MRKIMRPIHSQQGAALPLTLILLVVLSILATAAYELATNNQRMLAVATGTDIALYNAEQGLHKYLWQFNANPRFYEETSIYTAIDTGETDFNVYQRDDDDDGPYRVQIRIPVQNGTPVYNWAMIRSTGWDEHDPERLRTIEVQLVKRTFTQYGMVTNSEANENGDINYWVDDECFYGPIHTNDILYIDDYDPVFHGPVTYTNGISISPASRVRDTSVFRQGTCQADALVFPPTNDQLMAQARIGHAGDYYNGRTCIMLQGNSYDVRYWDRDAGTWKYNGYPYTYTRSTNSSNRQQERGTYRLTDTNTTYTSFAALRAAVASLPLPDNGVIYVNGLYGANGNGGRDYEYKFDPDYGNVFVSGELDGELTIAAANDIYITNYDPVDWRHPTYSCTSSSRTGGVTYSTTDFEQDFDGGAWIETVVTGNGDDMLGLIATRQMRILHYNWPSQESDSGYNWYTAGGGWGGSSHEPIDVAASNITIYAALYVKDISYGFEAPTVGSDKGTITLVGSVAQKYRGTVGTTGGWGGTGYVKAYAHDPRMLYDSPPHYIEPSNTGWQSGEWQEIAHHITSNPE